MIGKRLALILVVLSGFYANAILAESSSTPADAWWRGLSVGVDIGSIAGHLTNGLRIGSPPFFNGMARATLSGHLGWAQNVMSVTDTNYTWLPYGLIKLGIHVGTFVPDMPIRISSFADVAMVVPTIKISSKSVILGLDGGLDAEIFVRQNRQHALFVSLGGIGLFSPFADGLRGRPTIANGFTTSFGYRYYF